MKKNLDILIVEDSRTQAENLRFILESRNYSVVNAFNGNEALEVLETMVPKLILSDIVMPEMDGYVFCAKVKANKRLKGIPFVLLTSLSDTEDIIRGLESGADSFITKPFNKDFLLSKVEYLILNFELRRKGTTELGLEVLFGGKKHLITSDKLQILDLLISTYESAVIKNKELISANKDLKFSKNQLVQFNKNLEKTIEQRTGDLKKANENLKFEIEERILSEKKQNLVVKILSILNRPNDWHKLIGDILFEIREFSGIEATAIRLISGTDYPYFYNFGFQSNFIENENSLCFYNEKGKIEYDKKGNPVLACMCGKVISGNTQEDFPYFTKTGSFWINSTSDLLNNTADAKKIGFTRMYCSKEGYESVALIPVISGNKRIGLIHLGDKRKDQFTENLIQFYEEIAATIGIAYKRVMNEKIIKESEAQYRTIFETAANLITSVDNNGILVDCNQQIKSILGYTREEVIGKSMAFIIHPDYMVKAQNSLAEILEKGCTYNREYKMVRKDGEMIDVSINSSSINDAENKPLRTICIISDITERKQMVDDLSKSKKRYKKLFDDDLTGNYIKRADGTIEMCNPEFARMFGFNSPEEALGNNFGKLYSQKSDREKMLKSVKNEGKINDFKTWMKRIDGQAIHVVENSIGSFNEKGELTEITGYIFNDTERWLAEENVQNERKMLRTLIDNLPDAIYVKNAGGKKLIANPADIKIIGAATEESIIGKTDLELFSGEIGKRGFADDMDIVKTGNPIINREEKFYDENGNQKWSLTSKIPIFDLHGKTTGIVGIGRDITERVLAHQDLQIALQKAQIADNLKSSFLATMSHELRTPLNAIIGFSGLIDGDTSMEDILEYSKIVNSSGIQLLDIIQNIFDFSMIETGVIQLKKSQFELFTILNEAFHRISAEKERSVKPDVEIIFEPEKYNLELVVETDSEKLLQVFNYLLSNALKFTSRGEIEFGYSKILNNGNSFFEFYVRDTGIGIPKEKQDLIFEMFRQVDESNTRRFGGTGLGLAISKKLVELMGGSIRVDSEHGKGAVFYFTIPAVETERSEDAGKTRMVSGNKTILIVEDDEINFELLKLFLAKYNFDIIWAKRGDESVKICQNNPTVDLVLMDVNMPGISGDEATRQIKRIRPDLPVIIQSAYVMDNDKNWVAESGCDDFILKPINRDVLLEKTVKYLSKDME